jgi:hypothetical protein
MTTTEPNRTLRTAVAVSTESKAQSGATLIGVLRFLRSTAIILVVGLIINGVGVAGPA